jgi:hypothetical protein
MKRAVLLFIVVSTALFAVPLATAQNGTSQAGYGGQPGVQVDLDEASQASADVESSQAAPVGVKSSQASVDVESNQASVGVESTQESVGASAGETLPFTGTDLGLFVAGGLLLVLVGLGMRHFARQQQ